MYFVVSYNCIDPETPEPLRNSRSKIVIQDFGAFDPKTRKHLQEGEAITHGDIRVVFHGKCNSLPEARRTVFNVREKNELCRVTVKTEDPFAGEPGIIEVYKIIPELW